MKTVFAICALIAVASASSVVQEKAKNDQPKLDGEWAVTSMKLFGGKIPEDQAKKLKLVFTKDRFAISPGFAFKIEEKGPLFGKQVRQVSLIVGGKPMEDTYAVDFSKMPCAFDFLDDKGKPQAKGIIEIKGDTLKVFFNGEERPKGFDVEGGKKSMSFEAKKAPAKK